MHAASCLVGKDSLLGRQGRVGHPVLASLISMPTLHLVAKIVLIVLAHIFCFLPCCVLQAPLAELLMPEILRNLVLYASHKNAMLLVILAESMVSIGGHGPQTSCKLFVIAMSCSVLQVLHLEDPPLPRL